MRSRQVLSGIFTVLVAGPAAIAGYTAVILNPSGFDLPDAQGVSGGQQVGRGGGGAIGGLGHALLWSGTAVSAIDLTPPAGSQTRWPSVSPAVSRSASA